METELQGQELAAQASPGLWQLLSPRLSPEGSTAAQYNPVQGVRTETEAGGWANQLTPCASVFPPIKREV